MKNSVRPLLALAVGLVLGLGACASAVDQSYGNDSYATQIGFDSFNQSVKKRLASARLGGASQLFGTAPVLAAPDAYAAPSSRSATVGSRRQLDCVYYSGFTVWADLYQTWARQRSRGDGDGYKYRTTGPALGFDWSSNGWTLGLASTYAWGELKSRDFNHKRNTRQFALEAYAQYDTERFYANATLAYTYNRFRSQRTFDVGGVRTGGRDTYHSNAWNVDGEFGLKFNWGCFNLTPNVGLRYFRDRRNSVDESGSAWQLSAGRRNYYVLELPVAVDMSYEIATSRAIFIPRARLAWIPELARRRGNAEGNVAGIPFNQNAARRSRHGFQAGLGLEAKLTNSFSAHLDYDLKFRSRAYEHHWNLGVGFSF